MSDKIIMLCIVLVAVAVIAAVFIRRAISYRRRVRETSGEAIPPEEINLDKDGQIAYANIAIASSDISAKVLEIL